jgi:uncharacterized protein (DUF58 family)
VPRPRKRAASLLIGSILLFFLATNVQSGWLYVLSALLLGGLVAGWVIPMGGLRGLHVEREAPDRVHQGEETLVELIVSQRGRGTRRGVLVHDPHLEPADIWLGPVRAGEQVVVTTARTAARRGQHEGTRVRLRSSAPFGVAERRRSIDVGGRAGDTTDAGTATLVLPALVPLGRLPFIQPTFTADHAIHTAPRRGQGPEYLGIREYRAGDSMRHVHWPSTARTGSVMVREFEQEQTRRLAIVVDASRDEGETWTPLDRVCCAAASLASAALAQGNGARLVTPADALEPDPALAGPDILSRAAEDELFERLALLRPGGQPFPALVASMGDARELRGVETVVLVFPTWRENDAAALPPAVERLAEKIALVVAVPVVLTRHDAKQRVLDDTGVAGLEQRLRAAGAAVYPWLRDQDLAAALSEARGSA